MFKKWCDTEIDEEGLANEELATTINSEMYETLMDEVDLLDGAGNEYDEELIAKGELTPVFFGSALVDFGVTPLLEHYLNLSPSPTPRESNKGKVEPAQDFFSGFVFKIQANMNPNHRDRIAFVRICTGKFDRGMDVVLTRTGKKMKLSQSTQFMADERETVNEAFAGDVIGLYDSGNYQIGDTITNGDPSLQYEALPTFAPELFLKVYTKNALKSKQFQKGVEQLAQEGAIQVYKTEYNEIILGAIGQLQFEVFEHRLKGEYGVDILKDAANFQVAKWIKPAEVAAVKQLTDSRTVLVYDRWENAVLLFANDFVYERFVQKNEGTITLVDSPQQL